MVSTSTFIFAELSGKYDFCSQGNSSLFVKPSFGQSRANPTVSFNRKVAVGFFLFVFLYANW